MANKPVPAPVKKALTIAPPVKAAPAPVAPPKKGAPIPPPVVKAGAPPVKASPPPVAAPPSVKADSAILALLTAQGEQIKALGEALGKAKARASFEPIPLIGVLSPPDLTFGGTISADDWRHEMATYCRNNGNAPQHVYVRHSRYDAETKTWQPSGEERAPLLCYAGFPRDSDAGQRLHVPAQGKRPAHTVTAPPEGSIMRGSGMIALYHALSEDGKNVTDAPYMYCNEAEANALIFYPGQDAAPVEPTLMEQIQALDGVDIGEPGTDTEGLYWAPIGLDGKPMKAWAPLPT